MKGVKKKMNPQLKKTIFLLLGVFFFGLLFFLKSLDETKNEESIEEKRENETLEMYVGANKALKEEGEKGSEKSEGNRDSDQEEEAAKEKETKSKRRGEEEAGNETSLVKTTVKKEDQGIGEKPRKAEKKRKGEEAPTEKETNSSKKEFGKEQEEEESELEKIKKLNKLREEDVRKSLAIGHFRDKIVDSFEKPMDPEAFLGFKRIIPKHIYQTHHFNYDEMPPVMKREVKKIRELHPEYEYSYFNDEQAEGWMMEEYGRRSREYWAYKCITNGAFKADFWRYSALWKKGGWYLDSDFSFIQPIDYFVPEDITFVTPICNVNTHGLFNAFMGVIPKHPIMRRAMDIVISNIEGGYKLNEMDHECSRCRWE